MSQAGHSEIDYLLPSYQIRAQEEQELRFFFITYNSIINKQNAREEDLMARPFGKGDPALTSNAVSDPSLPRLKMEST